MDIDLSTDAPPDPERTLKLAEALPEIVRYLNHQTMDHAALSGPADAERLFRALSVMARRLPQLLTQTARWIGAEQAAGRIAVRSGDYAGRPSDAAWALRVRRDGAIVRAEDLGEALESMAEATSGMAGVEAGGKDDEA